MSEKFKQSYRPAGEGLEPKRTAVSESKWSRYGGKDKIPEGDEEPKTGKKEDPKLKEVVDANMLNPEQALILKEELQNKINQIFTDPRVFAKWQAYEKFRDLPIEETRRPESEEKGYDVYQLLDATSLNDHEVLDFKEQLQEMIDDILLTLKREQEKEMGIKAKAESLPVSITANDMLSDKDYVISIFEHGGHATKRGIKDYLERFIGKNVMETRRETRGLDRGISGVRKTEGGRGVFERRKSKARKVAKKSREKIN